MPVVEFGSELWFDNFIENLLCHYYLKLYYCVFGCNNLDSKVFDLIIDVLV